MQIYTKFNKGDVVKYGDYQGVITEASAYFTIELDDKQSIVEAPEDEISLVKQKSRSCSHIMVSRIREKGTYEFCPKCGKRV